MSGQDWPVGTVAVATVRGAEGVRVMRIRSELSSAEWVSSAGFGPRLHEPRDVTDIRPLVVLDLDERQLATVTHILRDNMAPSALLAADQIEAQTKPPRIPEPGLWGVVEASVRQYRERYRFGRTKRDTWVKEETGGGFNWSELVDPVLIRPGIEGES